MIYMMALKKPSRLTAGRKPENLNPNLYHFTRYNYYIFLYKRRV
jgi:hypothetical protein